MLTWSQRDCYIIEPLAQFLVVMVNGLYLVIHTQLKVIELLIQCCN